MYCEFSDLTYYKFFLGIILYLYCICRLLMRWRWIWRKHFHFLKTNGRSMWESFWSIMRQFNHKISKRPWHPFMTMTMMMRMHVKMVTISIVVLHKQWAKLMHYLCDVFHMKICDKKWMPRCLNRTVINVCC